MKKIIAIVLIAGFSTSAFSQEGNAFSRSFNNNKQQTEQLDDPGSGGGTEGGDPAPIDDYIPALAAVGLGMAVYFGRKKLIITN